MASTISSIRPNERMEPGRGRSVSGERWLRMLAWLSASGSGGLVSSWPLAGGAEILTKGGVMVEGEGFFEQNDKADPGKERIK